MNHELLVKQRRLHRRRRQVFLLHAAADARYALSLFSFQSLGRVRYLAE